MFVALFGIATEVVEMAVIPQALRGSHENALVVLVDIVGQKAATHFAAVVVAVVAVVQNDEKGKLAVANYY